MSYQQTLIELKKDVDKLLKEHPEWANLPIVSSSDEEGNSYGKIHNSLSPLQVHNINEYHLEVVGFSGEENIDDRDINCICIN